MTETLLSHSQGFSEHRLAYSSIESDAPHIVAIPEIRRKVTNGVTLSSEKNEPENKEAFALYGFKLWIPEDWRVEVNPKAARDRGDVVFHSPRRNRIYISWGPLEEGEKRFRTLDEHRDSSIENMKKSREVRSISITESREGHICGHRALTTRVTAFTGRSRVFTRKQPVPKDMNSVHFYCPERSRYYVVYSLLNSQGEYPNFSDLFDKVVQSVKCH